MANLFYRNPRLFVLTVALILVSGLSAWSLLPRLEDPELVGRFARILTPFPGASAERVEALVTEKIEDELRDVEEILELKSSSRAGISVVQIDLREDVGAGEKDEVWSRVRDRLADVGPELPPGALEPEFDEVHPEAFALIAALVWTGDEPLNHAVLRRLARELEDGLSQLSGTRQTELVGAPVEEVRVAASPEDLSALGLTAADLARLVAQSDAKAAAGQLRGVSSSFPIEVEGELDSLDRIRRIPVRTGDDGRVTRLSDFATVDKTIVDPPAELALIHGRRGIAVGARLRAGTRIDQWAVGAREFLELERESLPRGVELELVFDQSTYTEARLSTLMGNLALGAALVVLVVWFMMGWRSALLVGLALPLSALMVLAGMRGLGVPLHQMSVTGLIIALGLLIDNAIVMVDEVRGRLASGAAPADSVSKSVRHLFVPLLGSTLTTVLAFMPLVLMPGGAGEFVGTIAVSVILALVSSFFLAMTVVPTLAAWTDRGRAVLAAQRVARRHWWSDGFQSDRLTRGYASVLGILFAHPLLGIGLSIALPVFGFVQGGKLEEQFFPPSDRDQFQVQISLPAQTGIEETARIALEMRERMLAHDNVTAVHWFVGTSAPPFYYNLIGGRDGTPSFAQALVQLDHHAGAEELIRGLQDELDANFPEAQSLVLQLEQGPPFDAPVELRIYGPDLDVLRTLGEDVRREMSRVPDLIHTRATLGEAQPKLQLRVDEERARLVGLDRALVAGQLDGVLEGVVGGSLLEGTEELDVRVRLAQDARRTASDVSSLDLIVPAGRLPLTSLGTLELLPDSAGVPRRNRQRVNTVQGFVTAGVLSQTVLRDFQARLAPLEAELPPGYRFEFGGEAAERDEAVGNLMASVGLLLVMMVACLVLSFQSFTLAGVIGVVGLLSIGLGLGPLWTFGYPFGFMAIVGTMGLVGVAINDSIVVLAALREDAGAANGDRDAVVRVVLHSTRHVLATTVTTMAGFLPLILGGGGFWPPLALCIAGGVSGATLLALTFVPCAFTLLRRSRRKREDRNQARHEQRRSRATLAPTGA